MLAENLFLIRKLTFIDHVNQTVSAANKSLGFIIRNTRQFRNICTLIILCSVVRSKLEYCSLIGNHMYNCHIAHVESVQRQFLKYIYYRNNGSYLKQVSDYSILLNDFKLSPRRIYITILFL